MRTCAGKAAGTRRTTSSVAGAGCLAMMLGASGCTTPLVYSPVAPARAAGAYACAARQLENRAYLVREEEPGVRLLARKTPSTGMSGILGALLAPAAGEEQVIIGRLGNGPGSSTVLTLGPEKPNPTDVTMHDAREVLAACAPATPLAPGGLRCAARGRPLDAGEQVRLHTVGGGELTGLALALSGDTLAIATAGGPQQVLLPSLLSLERPMPVARRDVSRSRTLWGTAIGFAVGIAGVAIVGNSADDPSVLNDMFNWMLITPLAGLGIGWLSAAVLPDPVWRWRNVSLESCR